MTGTSDELSIGPETPTAPETSLSREAVAQWLLTNSDLLLRRIRGKIRSVGGPAGAGPLGASLLDGQDILSSVLRRVDAAAAEGRLRTHSEAELWGYVSTLTQNVLQQRLRQGARDTRLYASLTERERAQAGSVAEAKLDQLAPLLHGVLSSDEWELLRLRSRGCDGRATAGATSVSEEAGRKRWSRLVATVRARLASP